MKKYVPILIVIFLFLPVQIHAQKYNQTYNNSVDYPWVPRVSAYEAYTKYRNGKAIILHAGGELFRKRHIVGAFNVDLKKRESILNKFPREGIEIFAYCY